MNYSQILFSEAGEPKIFGGFVLGENRGFKRE